MMELGNKSLQQQFPQMAEDELANLVAKFNELYVRPGMAAR